MHLLGIVCIIYVIYQLIKESFTKPLSAEDWENKDLYHQDHAHLSQKECIKNAERGRYRMPKQPHPEPHRNAEGKILIENGRLWAEDLRKHGSLQVNEWAAQGRYNLAPAELEAEKQRIILRRLEEKKRSRGSLSEEEQQKLEELLHIRAAAEERKAQEEAVRQEHIRRKLLIEKRRQYLSDRDRYGQEWADRRKAEGLYDVQEHELLRDTDDIARDINARYGWEKS